MEEYLEGIVWLPLVLADRAGLAHPGIWDWEDEELHWGSKLCVNRHWHASRSKHISQAYLFTQAHIMLKPWCTAVKGQNGFLHRHLYRLLVILQRRPRHQWKVNWGCVFVLMWLCMQARMFIFHHALAKTVKQLTHWWSSHTWRSFQALKRITHSFTYKAHHLFVLKYHMNIKHTYNKHNYNLEKAK